MYIHIAANCRLLIITRSCFLYARVLIRFFTTSQGGHEPSITALLRRGADVNAAHCRLLLIISLCFVLARV